MRELFRLKLIIAGGRDNRLTDLDIDRLMDITASEIVSGGARGIDSDGEEYAKARGLPCTVFRADWKRYKRAAGHIRNQEMAQYADAVALFPGGKGTNDMFSQSRKNMLYIYDYRKSRDKVD